MVDKGGEQPFAPGADKASVSQNRTFNRFILCVTGSNVPREDAAMNRRQLDRDNLHSFTQ